MKKKPKPKSKPKKTPRVQKIVKTPEAMDPNDSVFIILEKCVEGEFSSSLVARVLGRAIGSIVASAEGFPSANTAGIMLDSYLIACGEKPDKYVDDRFYGASDYVNFNVIDTLSRAWQQNLKLEADSGRSRLAKATLKRIHKWQRRADAHDRTLDRP